MVMLYVVLKALMLAALAVLLWPLGRRHRQFTLWVCALFFLGGFGMYALVGAPEIVPLMHERDTKIAELKDVITKRASDVKANPNDLAAWVELGQSFVATSQYSAAANAFRRAVLISKGNPVLIMAYAKSLIMEADGKVTDDAKKSLEMAAMLQPKNPEPRYWLIVRQLQDGKAQEAMKAMKALYKTLPEGSPLKQQIDRQIGRAN